jgi:glycosyltransferase involved in cell wall biosynthesis
MKILHLISSAGYYGAENVALELARVAAQRGNEVTLGVFRDKREPHTELAEAALAEGVTCRLFDCGGKLDARTVLELRKYIKDNSMDIVHSHGYKSNIYSVFASAFTGAKTVTTVHNWIRTGAKLRAYSLLDKLFLRYFDFVFAVSEELRREITASGVPGSRVLLIPNGINVRKYRAASALAAQKRRELDIKPGDQVIGTVGRLSGEKGHRFLIEAAGALSEEFPLLKFLFVGDGPLRSRLEAQALEAGLGGRVIFAGERRDIPELLALMDIFVLPSLTEGLPMALLEAMAAGKPVVATGVGFVTGLLSDAQSGILVSAGDARELELAVKDLLADGAKARLYAENAARTVARDFTGEAMALRYLESYAGVLAGGKRNGSAGRRLHAI